MNLNPVRKLKKLICRSMFFRWYAERILNRQPFQLGGTSYSYVVHPHNFTWTNERAVELAIAAHALENESSGRVLEVGNVTRHYLGTSHEVVDKYEKANGIQNVDIVDYSPTEKYDFVFAISTLEHVGWDRDQREGDKIPLAVDRMKELLNQGGNMLVTVPVGFNSFLDQFLETNALGFDQTQFMRRVSGVNEWVECGWDQVKGAKYNSPYNNANAIAILKYRKS